MSEITPVDMGNIGTLRWFWRQLTSMKTALILLMLLAIGSIPGSLVPQRNQNPIAVNEYILKHAQAAKWMERFSLFNVFGSPWFSAIYLLLFISLIGCVIPRMLIHIRALSARPPKTPQNLDRLTFPRSTSVNVSPEEILNHAQGWFKKNRFRWERSADSISAEKGYLRESGNVLFHLSLILFLVAMGVAAAQGSKGEAIVVEGDTFTNSATSYDNLTNGSKFDLRKLSPFTLKIDRFLPTYDLATGAPVDYKLFVTSRESGGTPKSELIRVNHPLSFGSTNVYLQANGYAPVVTVKDGAGNVVMNGPVVFLPQDANLTSTGAIKLPDAAPTQLGFIGTFLPTAAMDKVRGGFSTFPDAVEPRLLLSAWTGDLGLDKGVPQSVYRLDTVKMKRIGLKELSVGGVWTLPDGVGSITFQGWERWVNLQVVRDPGKGLALTGAILAILGLLATLFVKRRRIWVRARLGEDGATVISIAGLTRQEYEGFEAEMNDFWDAITGRS